MMKKKPLLIVLILVQICLLSGCWSKKELDEISILSGVGIDVGEEKQLRLTMQVILHREMKIESQSGKRGGEEKPTQNVVVEGNSLIDANRNYILQTGRRGYWSHINVLIIGEELAKKGISPILDVLERDQEVRRRTYLLVAKGNAKEILDAETIDLEIIQAFNISDMVKLSESNGKNVMVDLHRYFLRASKNFNNAFMTGIGIIDKGCTNNLELMDTAIFNENKLVGWFDNIETRGLLWVLGEIQSCIIEVQYPLEKGLYVYIDNLRASSSIKPVIRDNTLEKLIVNIASEGKVAESNTEVDLSKGDIIKKLEEDTAKVIEEEVYKAIEKGKELEVDIFTFDEAINRENPKLWKEIEDYWLDIFPSVPVEVNVDMTIRRTGLITKSNE
ncbi:Ger(x)C family spore germination protein [Vallitalea pronyensis]|uniref:Ger(X)C family spore germination protein n=1 Tax=Vallitalea pronyensis TaxID=1348613 RepID=A0A8J8MGE7_9FIRM|nr:Ger(x)C family spore germination protein [Vallitalea pronyensis]QUI21094.1 Ger(x)C family spore germination protein [Vallitalea pronyensis]